MRDIVVGVNDKLWEIEIVWGVYFGFILWGCRGIKSWLC